MGKKSRIKNKAAKKERMPYVARTFEGLPHEADWIALREFVPSATAVIQLASGRSVRICSLLPGNGAGIVRPDGEIWVGLQVAHNFGDISRDLAYVVETALELEPGQPVPMGDPGVGPRLQDLIDPSSGFEVEVHQGFDYWVEGTEERPETADLLAEANDTVAPTVRLESVESAYWTEMGPQRFLRWVMTEDETPLLDALARLRVRGEDTLGDGTKLIGHFRGHGRLVPVWEFEVDAAALEEPARAFRSRLDVALADDSPLTTEERSARNSIVSRQVTI
ncbi:topoisomerase II [Aeromicrobium sp. A1-2]|uniref:DUF5926 family protein n=1 Tax=Aeromicrobium sp. A1-2 TaxID=2107713 RepID=UPI000E4C97EA|nr:DUF5926 family protein [Aeromicrobium sp. A1-2]AXT86380.1 topoisomerase II [Aeromicrobium sp. A1-2]